jgi:uncharacterized SAM-binding protein YcdF (DUF218 family)
MHQAAARRPAGSFQIASVAAVCVFPITSGEPDRVSLRLLLTALVLPPFGLVLLAILGWFLGLPPFGPRGRRAGRAITGVCLLVLVVLAMPVTGLLLTAGLEAGLPLTPPPGAPPQAIVILSAEARRGGGSHPEVTVGPMTLWRLLGGVRLARRTHLPILVTGGILTPGEPPIAALMARTLAEDFATPARWVEGRSRDTWRNAAYSAPMLLRDGVRSIYIVTDAFHERRALIAFGRFPLTLTAAPPLLDSPLVLRASDFIPSLGGWRGSYLAIHEWVGCAYYALRRRSGGAPDAS